MDEYHHKHMEYLLRNIPVCQTSKREQFTVLTRRGISCLLTTGLSCWPHFFISFHESLKRNVEILKWSCYLFRQKITRNWSVSVQFIPSIKSKEKMSNKDDVCLRAPYKFFVTVLRSSKSYKRCSFKSPNISYPIESSSEIIRYHSTPFG